MRRKRIGRLAACALVCVALASCDKSRERGATQPDEQNQAAESSQPGGVDAECQSDRDCESYYRCIEQVCAVPPGVAGEHDDETPVVEFVDGDTGETLATFYVEIADTEYERSRGLMFRRELAKGWGMLFVYESSEFRRFWMENTFIGLDIVFVDSSGVVDSVVERAEPLTDVGRTSDGPAQYVVELNAGTAETYGIDAGDRVKFVRVPEAYTPGGRGASEQQ